MHRYIDAEKLLDQFLELCGGKSCLSCQFFEHGCNLELMILNQPIADIEPVVRCEDCIFGRKFYNVVNGVADNRVDCRNPDGLNRFTLFDEYCSAGMLSKEDK